MKTMAKLVTVILLGGLAGFPLALYRGQGSAPAKTESAAWGAIDPTWSPDGSSLAFTLFGSIWRVPAGGGVAEQLTTSSGYHGHPAWSADGTKIAYIRGDAPAGRIPNIFGKLVLFDVTAGTERELSTPQPVAGTPTWSPDGNRIVCGLRLPGGSLLHEISVADGKVTQIQFPLPGNPAGPWVDVAWNPKQNEIFFAAQRLGAPQIWSMPSSNPPIMIQMPLTRYRLQDIVQLQKLAAVPSGSDVVYSAVVVNGKGDFELYRVPRAGGSPVAITNTPRDEFSPAVSPDGKLIAHVSNHLGNIDIFTMPIAGGDKKHVAINSLKFRQPSGQVRVRTQDALGKPTPVRLYVRASDGKAYSPAGSSIFYYPLEPGGQREGFFVASGEERFSVPAGRLQIVAQKGIEYRIAEQNVDIAPGATAEVTLTMERWTDWSQRGWYTGENHFHANYNGSYYQRPADSLRWLQAEDLNVANMIVANAAGAFIHDKEFFRGSVDPLSSDRYILYWGQEYRNSDPLGHMAFLNIKKQVPPSYTSVIGSDSSYDFPLNTMAALEARQQGGLVSYVHPMGAGGDVFDTGLGAKESPVTAALGGMDSIDILPFGRAATELWYRLLNCGFKIAPGAGTDVFTNWRGINSIPGGAREYVEVGSGMNWNRWIDRYREGRNFVTTGPLLTFDVNGQPLGSEIRVPAGQTYRAQLTTEVTSRTPLRLVEFIQNGNVIESRQPTSAQNPVRMEKEVAVSTSCWFAVRVTGEPARGILPGIPRAHSGAIYVHVGGQHTLIKEDVELMIRWVDRLWLYLEERDNLGPGDNRARARKMFDQAREHYTAKLAKIN
jgi:TolB protein